MTRKLTGIGGESTLVTNSSSTAVESLGLVLNPSELAELSGEGILVVGRGITRDDVEGLKADPIYKTRKTTIKANFIVEKIPVKSTNNINSLISSSKIWNKPVGPYNIIGTDNFINSAGASVKLSVSGDDGTKFKLVVQDVTNTKYYDWYTQEFTNGYNALDSAVGEEGAQLVIPSTEVETEYKIYNEQVGGAIINNNPNSLPTEKYPWVINQLPSVTTTFKFSVQKGFIPDQSSTKIHPPGHVLNTGSINDGKIPITITTTTVRGTIALSSERLINPKVYASDISTDTDDESIIVDTDLIVSVDDAGTGTITGTIILGKSAKRDTNILFNPVLFFTIT